MRVHSNVPLAVATSSDEWHHRCEQLEQWISAHDNQLPKRHSDVVADALASWLWDQKRCLKQLSAEQQLRLVPILQLQVCVKKEQLAEVPVVRSSIRVTRGDSGDAVSVSQEMDDALADASDLTSSFARKRVVFTAENATKQDDRIGKQAYDTSKCMARTTGKKQCQRKRARNSEFCEQHRKSAALGSLPHGRCDNPLLTDGLVTKSTRT